MTIQFNLEYHTRWGQSVWIIGSLPELGAGQSTDAVPMKYSKNGIWQFELTLSNPEDFTYRYIIRESGKEDHVENGNIHQVTNIQTNALIIIDQWQDILPDQPFYSSAFTKCIFSQTTHLGGKPLEPEMLAIQCYAPQLSASQNLLLSGNCPTCGDWDPRKALPMQRISPTLWEIILERKANPLPFNFKFIKNDPDSVTPFIWEEGPDHTLPSLAVPQEDCVLIGGLHFRSGKSNWKGAGVAIPVFSLRSEEGYGIGEFSDLIPLIDWAANTGQKIIQILPVNDTTMTHTWRDSYPYNANSIFALHPAYLRIEEAGVLNDELKMAEFRKKRDQLNKLDEIDYEQANAVKWDYMRALFNEAGKSTLGSAPFKQFFEANKEWLVPYAAFSYLRDKYETPDFHWWDTLNRYDKAEVERMSQPDAPEYPEIALYYFIQYHLDKQLSKVSNYARNKGIALKGDIPIGISRTSVDAWVNPELFHMDCQAGAPPDDFSRQGQNWGFPTYNWEEMKKDQYKWWKKRFAKMSDYFDAYRIDHILGFFRIWEIPVKSTQGLLGHFNPALPLSADEIRSFGFNFDEERHCKPYIREYFLNEFFGDATEEVKNDFLDITGWQMFALKKEYDTQREIASDFEGETDEKSLQLRDGLLRLLSEVLFIPAKDQPGKYHPRIAAHDTKSYDALDAGQKDAYNRLYNYFFYERHNDFWRHEALEKLPSLIGSTDMLACGEDLGMIPDGVEDVMNILSILSLEVQRMPKKQGATFDNPQEYPYLSVCTTSTHDMSTLREWWEENKQLTQRYYNEQLHEPGEAPQHCTPVICEKIIDQHLQSPAMFTILPLQDWLSVDGELRRDNAQKERINIPAISRYYWRYRMHLTTTELLQATGFNEKIKEMITASGR